MASNDALKYYVASILPSIGGWCGLNKTNWLIDCIIEKKPQVCVEIGVFYGSSLIVQALSLHHNKKGKVFGIDPWDKDAALEEMKSEENRKWWGNLNYDDIYQSCQKTIIKHQIQDYCELIRKKSEDAVRQFQDGSVNLLHWDGNHSEELSYRDATLWLPKMKQGGYIFFNDIFWTDGDENVTTRKSILYLIEYCQRIDVVDNCMVLEVK